MIPRTHSAEMKYTEGLADIIQMVVLLGSFHSLYFPCLPCFLQQACFISILEKNSIFLKYSSTEKSLAGRGE